MSTSKKRVDLFNSEESEYIRRALRLMVTDNKYKTESSYTANVSAYPTHKMPFVESHLTYLSKHPQLNPDHYLANLRISLKIRK